MLKKICVMTFLTFYWCSCSHAYESLSPTEKAEAGSAAVEMLADAINGNCDKSKFNYDMNSGLDLSFWKPGFDEDKVVKITTEGLKTYHIGANFAYGGKSMLVLRYERPFEGAYSQEDSFKTNTRQKSGLEKFTGGVKLDPLADLLFPDNVLLKKILSVKYQYSKESFFAEVTAQKEFALLPQGAVVDYGKKTISGSSIVTAGEKLEFSTEFINQEISIPLVSLDMMKTVSYNGRVENVSFFQEDFRVGYFDFQWSRPSHGTSNTLDGKPIISDTTFKAQGYFLGFEAQDPGSPGLNLDWLVRIGLDGEVNNASNYNKSDVSFVGMNINSWYNHYFSSRNEGLAATLGFLFDWRRMNVDEKKNETSTSTVRIFDEQEKLYKVYLNIVYRF